MRTCSLYVGLLATVVTTVLAAPLPASGDFGSQVAKGLRLLSLEDGAEPVWKTEAEKLDLIRAHKHFMDVTDVYEADQARAGERKAPPAVSYPDPSHQAAVKPLLAQLSTDKMSANLDKLAAYNNRYYNADTGAQAATWLQGMLPSLFSGRSDISVKAFKHSFKQTSTIVHINGKDDSAPITIIGAHLDSINQNSPQTGRAPGADDDGSGAVNLIDILRVLAAGGFKPSTPVEFHWYAGEEGGLLGSQDIASSYSAAGKKVKAMMELDMTAYFAPGSKEVIALADDYVAPGLNAFVTKVVNTYTSLPTANDHCGYACSDHASWYKYNYPTTEPYEAVTGNDNPRIHGPNDAIGQAGFSWTHSLEFAKMGLAYIYELAV